VYIFILLPPPLYKREQGGKRMGNRGNMEKEEEFDIY